MSKYLIALENDIRRHKNIKELHQLKTEQWNKSCFELCTQVIHQALNHIFSEEEQLHFGTSISYKTIQSIFNRSYRIKYPMDPRTLNTLTKLVRFTGYNSWDDFIKEVDNSVDADLFSNEDQTNLVSFVREAIRISFDAIYKQSTNGKLDTYFASDQSAFRELEEIIVHNSHQKNTISNPYNPSTYEIMDIKIESISDNQAKIKTQEFWLLCWWNRDQEKYIKRLKDINEHNYILEKKRGKWKIRSDVTLSDKY